MKSRKVILTVIIITSIVSISCSLFSVAAAAPEVIASPTFNPTLVSFGLTLVADTTTATVVTPQPTGTPTDTATPVPTPTQTPTPTLPATDTPIPLSCYQASFVADVTVPDGADFNPGDAFTKTWRIINNGVCQWNTNFKLVFDNGEIMSGASTVIFPNNVDPGQTVDLSVDMVAPSDAGNHIGYWKLETDQGINFGLGSNDSSDFWVSISVNSATEVPTDISSGTDTPTEEPIIQGTEAIQLPCDLAKVDSSSTIPNSAFINPGTPFTKTWRLLNIGSCSWNTNFKLAFDNGNSMSGPNSINLPGNVDPGQEIKLSLNLVAPKSVGVYVGNWKLQTDQGTNFGIGFNGTYDLQVSIKVANPAPTVPTSTPTPTHTPKPTTTHHPKT